MTVEKVMKKYPEIKTVIPGHGDFGGIELLTYTVELVKKEKTSKLYQIFCKFVLKILWDKKL